MRKIIAQTIQEKKQKRTVAVCPICKQAVSSSRLKRHLRRHKLSPEDISSILAGVYHKGDGATVQVRQCPYCPAKVKC